MFTVMELSWSKRRPTDKQKPVELVEVIGFEKKSGHRCQVVAIVDGVEKTLNGRVYSRETYEIMEDGSTKTHLHGWGVQGTDHMGTSIGLRYEEE